MGSNRVKLEVGRAKLCRALRPHPRVWIICSVKKGVISLNLEKVTLGAVRIKDYGVQSKSRETS